ncbi:membrane protein [Oscillospiraceae bacterium]|nr:membrane protein [Oscillospiraceae bacterium]BDF73341.1 membrane protein [Oscillospiraceae bacterium]
MVTLLIIADDFTGALDTGVQFASSGAVTRVVTEARYDFSSAEAGVQVLVVDAETRHLTPEGAYGAVRGIVENAVRAGIPYIYKKTDSALRGNIGSELQAVLDGSGRGRIHFIPALPGMGRVTVDGVHYVDGVPVAEGVFGRDPFEPVKSSGVAEIIAEQTGTPVHLHKGYTRKRYQPGIHVHDAATGREVEEIAEWLKAGGELGLTAGCAGFAAALPGLLELEGRRPKKYPLSPALLVVCGSVNPITQAQLDDAEKHGFARVRLTPAQKLDPAWLYSEECQRAVTAWINQLSAKRRWILDANDLGAGETLAYAGELGLTREELRVRISTTLGGLLKRLLDQGAEGTLLLTGGDTLLAFMRQIGVGELIPAWEAAPGVVLSRLSYQGKAYDVITKSGGFGERSLLTELADSICTQRDEEEKIC